MQVEESSSEESSEDEVHMFLLLDTMVFIRSLGGRILLAWLAGIAGVAAAHSRVLSSQVGILLQLARRITLRCLLPPLAFHFFMQSSKTDRSAANRQ